MLGGPGVRDQSTPLQKVVKSELQLTSRSSNVQCVPRRVLPVLFFLPPNGTLEARPSGSRPGPRTKERLNKGNWLFPNQCSDPAQDQNEEQDSAADKQ